MLNGRAARTLFLLTALGCFSEIATAPAARAPLSGMDRAAATLADSLLASVPQRSARVIDFAAGKGRLGLGTRAGVERRSALTLAAADSDSLALAPDEVLGEVDITTLSENELGFEPRPGTAPARVQTGQLLRVFLERHTLVLAAPMGEALTVGAAERLMTALRLRLDSPAFRLLRMPALLDTAEAQMLARAGSADLFGWTEARKVTTGIEVTLTLCRAKNGARLPTLTAVIPANDADLAPAGRDEDPAATLPGCRPAWSGAPLPGVNLEMFPRRFKTGAVDFYFADRVEGWRLKGGTLERWQDRPLDDIWPPTVGTRWPVGALLPINSYFGRDRAESRVFYAFCSNQRPRYLSVSVTKENPDSLMLSLSDGPLDSLNGCSGSCFAQVDRVERISRFPPPKGLPKTAGTRLALGRVDLGPTGLPSYDEKGYVKTRKSALVFYDLASATLWLAAADTAFQVPGHFGDRIEGFRIGKSGPAGFLVTSADPVGRSDRLQYWVWDERRLTLRWQSDPYRGSLTGLQVMDLDGNAREDVVVGETFDTPSGPRTRVRLYLAALEPGGAAR